jgi:undecaprenyl-phosphate 4-deoxy-4-formamido-L-arabinose transferase
VLGFLLGIYVIIEKLLNPLVPLGYASLYSVVSIFSGVQLMSIGMIGEYVGRIFISQNKRPQYTIRKKYEQECKRV